MFLPQNQPVDNLWITLLFLWITLWITFLDEHPAPFFSQDSPRWGVASLLMQPKIFGLILCHFLRLEPRWREDGVGRTGFRSSKGASCEDLGGSVLGLGYGFRVADGGAIPGSHVFLRLPWWKRFSPFLINIAHLQYKIPNTP